jgi:hypothetical protein
MTPEAAELREQAEKAWFLAREASNHPTSMHPTVLAEDEVTCGLHA